VLASIMEERPDRVSDWTWVTPAWRHRLAVAVLFLVVFATYRPALQHPPRQDQWSFLLETVNEDRFWPMLLQTYSYNRTSAISWGDYLLFRPVLFATLCAEKALFGPRYAYWQAAGIALHGAVVWLLLRLLRRLHQLYPAATPATGRLRLALAYAVALFFAVNFAGIEMVVWCHIHGYLVFVLLVLGGLLLLLDELCGAAPRRGLRWRLGGAWVLSLLAAFTYETGAVYAVCIGIVLGLRGAAQGQARRGLLLFVLFAAILPGNRVVDWLDRRQHPDVRPDATEVTLLERAEPAVTLDNARRYLLFTLYQPFFPSCPRWDFHERIILPEPDANPHAYWRRKPALFVSYAVVLGSAALALWQGCRLVASRQRSALLFVLLPASLILFNLLIIVLGRMNLRPEPVTLYKSSYYAYTPLLLLLVILFFLWARLPLAGTLGLVAPGVVLAGLVVLSADSAHKVYAMNLRIRDDYRPLRDQIDCVQQVIDRHRHDPHFALSFDPPVFHSLDTYHSVSLLEIAFSRWCDHERPTHVVCAVGGKWLVLCAQDYRDLYGGPHYQQLPAFVAGGKYMLFKYRQRYYGLYWEEGRFRTDRADYLSLLEGNSVEEVRRQVPAALPRAIADRCAGRYNRPSPP
jgi:hypothetical protein